MTLFALGCDVKTQVLCAFIGWKALFQMPQEDLKSDCGEKGNSKTGDPPPSDDSSCDEEHLCNPQWKAKLQQKILSEFAKQQLQLLKAKVSFLKKNTRLWCSWGHSLSQLTSGAIWTVEV